MLSYDSNSFSTHIVLFCRDYPFKKSFVSSFGVKLMVPLEDFHFQIALQMQNRVTCQAKFFITNYFAL